MFPTDIGREMPLTTSAGYNEIKAAKIFLQMLSPSGFSVSKSRRKFWHESYQRQHTQSLRA